MTSATARGRHGDCVPIHVGLVVTVHGIKKGVTTKHTKAETQWKSTRSRETDTNDALSVLFPFFRLFRVFRGSSSFCPVNGYVWLKVMPR